MRVYITHCCSKKVGALKGTGELVTPDKLYAATPTKRFMRACIARQVSWAIFSDAYGVWFPGAMHEWYEKDPNCVSEAEFASLLDDFDTKLESFDEIWFYCNPGRFHGLYRRLLAKTRLRDRVRKFTHLSDIEHEKPLIHQGAHTDMSDQDLSRDSGGTRVALKEAARVLSELHICKAYGPRGNINTPNCQRFGHRDPKSKHWYWEISELIREAQTRGSASADEIRAVGERYRTREYKEGSEKPEAEGKHDSPPSSADIEHFRAACVQLEHSMRRRFPSPTPGLDRHTIGNLIRDAEAEQIVGRAALQEMWFVNSVRNAVFHSGSEKISHERIKRATESARALCHSLDT